MTHTTAIILNAVLVALVLAGLARIVWFGFKPGSHETLLSGAARDERATERKAA
jgi:flagellar basal body-associated protein FliL